MKELEYQIPDGSLYFTKQGEGLEVTHYQGLAGHVEIPERIAGRKEMPGAVADAEGPDTCADAEAPVKSIGKKAFLSKKYLRSVTIPESVTEVGDWAFAYCDALREVTFEGRGVTFGKSVFLECPNLRCVRFPGILTAKAPSGKASGLDMATLPCGGAGDLASMGRTYCDGIGALTAAAVTQMESPYLLNAAEAGSKEWLAKWDARMLAILGAADDEGYSKQILCGEEDYESADLETYLTNSRKKKVRLLLLRLLAPMELEPAREEELRRYLLAHTKGCKTDETWQVVRDECGDRREFYELFARIGCLTKENAPAIIAETKEEHPEMKAFFLKFQADHFQDHDFFSDLEL